MVQLRRRGPGGGGVLEVLRPGLQSTVQDAGRRARALGMPACGAADGVALRLANALVGNAPGAAALEVTLSGPHLHFQRGNTVALVGAPFGATLDGLPFPMNRAVNVRAGQRLDIGAAGRGMRAVLAVRGGLVGQEVYGSRATDLKGEFGGHQGRALQKGDTLHWHAAEGCTIPPGRLHPSLLTPCGPGHHLRVMATPELTAPQRRELLGRTLRASAQADRMGLRLSAPVTAHHDPSRVSLPNVPGMIQLPPDGRPILLLPDAGTHGGYPTPLVVIRADLPRLAQIRPGDTLDLALTDARTATALDAQQERKLRQLEGTLRWFHAQR